MEEIVSTASLETSIWNLPSESVKTPFFEPFSSTFAPTIGSPFVSDTVPNIICFASLADVILCKMMLFSLKIHLMPAAERMLSSTDCTVWFFTLALTVD